MIYFLLFSMKDSNSCPQYIIKDKTLTARNFDSLDELDSFDWMLAYCKWQCSQNLFKCMFDRLWELGLSNVSNFRKEVEDKIFKHKKSKWK